MKVFPNKIYPSSFPKEILKILKDCIVNKGTRLANDSIIIFTCGAMTVPGIRSRREELLYYAQKHIHDYHFFRAEDIFPVLQKKNKDLLSVEDSLAELSDCILVILESEGALVELGAFSIKDPLAKIMLVINDIRYVGNNSFIEKGPITKINRRSDFKPVIYANFKSISLIFNEIENRLRKIRRKNRKTYDLSTFQKFNNSGKKIRFLFFHDLINLFSPLTFFELEIILKNIYGKNNERFNFDMEIGVLKSIGLIKVENGYLVTTSKNKENFFNFEFFDPFNLRARIVNFYFKKNRKKFDYLLSRN